MAQTDESTPSGPGTDPPPTIADTLEFVDGDPVASNDHGAIGKIHRACGQMVRADGNQLVCGCGGSNVGH